MDETGKDDAGAESDDETGRSRQRHCTGFDVDAIRKDFPILGDIIYLDNAATSFSPEPVIGAMVEFEHNYRANVGRGVHRLTRIASQRYWHAHEKVAEFIGGKTGVTVFTKNTTEAINMVAQGLPWKPGDRVLTTVLEHHSNLLPWMNLAKKGVATDIVGIGADYLLDPATLEAAITTETRLVAVTHASNVLGVVTPVERDREDLPRSRVLLLVDAAQTVPHMPVDVSRIGCDFCAFSGHKMLGPTGTGVLWMKDDSLEPFMVGGGMVETVTKAGFTPESVTRSTRPEPRTLPGASALGLQLTISRRSVWMRFTCTKRKLTTRLIDGLKKIGRSVSMHRNRHGTASASSRLRSRDFTPTRLPSTSTRRPISWSGPGTTAASRSWSTSAFPEGTVRASIGLYNTRHEIDMLIATVEEIAR